MSEWNRVDRQRPCQICGKTDWCSVSADAQFAICRRVGGGDAKAKLDKSGAEYWVYRLSDAPVTVASPVKRKIGPSALPSASLNAMYTDLLKFCVLAPPDRDALLVRGLSAFEIQSRNYKTLAKENRSRIASRLVELYGEDLCLRLPGFFLKAAPDGRRYFTLAGPEGLLIPVRNVRGEIVALKVRRRGEDQPRYLYMSSVDKGGTGSGSPVHVPVFKTKNSKTIRLTEGELKADVATVLSGLPTISIPGVATWRQAIPVLRELGCVTCRLAFDMDAFKNEVVANALTRTAVFMLSEGFEVEIEVWDPQFKGIDDCLAAGGRVRLLSGERGLIEVLGTFEKITG